MVISDHLYYFVWLVHCNLCATTAFLRRCRRHYCVATAPGVLCNHTAITGDAAALLAFPRRTGRRSGFINLSILLLINTVTCIPFLERKISEYNDSTIMEKLQRMFERIIYYVGD